MFTANNYSFVSMMGVKKASETSHNLKTMSLDFIISTLVKNFNVKSVRNHSTTTRVSRFTLDHTLEKNHIPANTATNNLLMLEIKEITNLDT